MYALFKSTHLQLNNSRRLWRLMSNRSWCLYFFCKIKIIPFDFSGIYLFYKHTEPVNLTKEKS